MFQLIGWQWKGYPRYHRSRINLVLHIIFVPVFLVGNVALVAAIVRGTLVGTVIAMTAIIASIAVQGRGHRWEAIPPEPFGSFSNALARIFCEQWVTFPRFVLSGGWSNALRHAP